MDAEKMSPNSSSPTLVQNNDRKEQEGAATTIVQPTFSHESTMAKVVNTGEVPKEAQLPISPRQHKRGIFIAFTITILTSSLLPIALYYAFKYGAHLSNDISLNVPTAIFGVFALYQLLYRTWVLGKKNSTVRPINGKRWQLDYFQYNFFFGFSFITVVISVGSSGSNAGTNLRVIGMSLVFLMFQVCLQQILGAIWVVCNVKYPMRFSSMPKGKPVRAALYTICEDICAVDVKLGAEGFRKPWNARWECSPEFQKLLRKLDWIWGVSGTAAAAVLVILIWTIPNAEAAYCVGWLWPWLWGGILAVITVRMSDAMLVREKAYFASLKSGSIDSV